MIVSNSPTLLFGLVIAGCVAFAMFIGGLLWLVDEIKERRKKK